MALTYTTAKSTLDEIAVKITTAERRLARARELLVSAEAELAAMSSVYGPFVIDLEDEVITQNNALWDQAKAEKDEMVGDFNSLQERAAALITAYDSV